MANRGRPARARVSVMPSGLGEAVTQSLTLYHEDVNAAIDQAAKDAAKSLVKKTRATAPTGARGSFRKNIASKRVQYSTYHRAYVWHVKAPDYRLTHLLVKGHATRDGWRTQADPFLANAWGEVQPEYLDAIKEALQNGG